MQSIRILAIAAGWAIAVFGMPVTAQAQTIDTSAAHATVGSPLHLTLRVRDFEPGPASLDRTCLQAELQQGDTTTPAQPLRWLSTARTSEGETWVTLTSAQAIDEPILRIKVALLCGASFVREFTLLAEPPPPSRAATARAPVKLRTSQRERPFQPTASSPSAMTRVNLDLGSTDRVAIDSSRWINPLPPEPSAAASATANVPPGASPLTDAFVQIWQQDMLSVREELLQSRAALASMRARLERSERNTWELWGGLAALAAGLAMTAVLWRLVHEVRLRRFTRIDPRFATPTPAPANSSAVTAAPPVASSVASARPSPPPITDMPAQAPAFQAQPTSEGSPDPAEPLVWDEQRDHPPSRWAQSDFGQPALDETRHLELLAKVDTITAGGYYGASVAVLENALQSRVGKSAAILLRLLDLYRLLNQPWNHERVSAEIEAIYNVQVPSIEQSAEGRNLDEHERTWQEIALSWGTAQASDQLAQVLVRPTRIEVLDLAAFRDALMLHTMSTLRDEPTARMTDNTTTDPDELPSLPWLVQGAAV